MDASSLKPIAKLLWNIGVAVAVAIPTVFDDFSITGVAEWCLFLAALANAVLVWWVPEMRSGLAKHAKGAVAIIVAATAVIPTLALDGWTHDDTFAVIALVVGAIATPLIPNRGYVYARKLAGQTADRQTL